MIDRDAGSARPGSRFEFFPLLPIEIRYMIWQHCLPHRTLEIRCVENSPAQVCWGHPKSRTLALRKPPVIAQVCHESRTVAFRRGRLRILSTAKDISQDRNQAWFDTSTDTLHLTWWAERRTLVCSLPDFIDETEDLAMDRWMLQQHLTPEQVATILNNGTPFPRVRLIQVVFYSFEVCVTHDDAVSSGLFGSHGERSVVAVSTKERDALAKYATFYLEKKDAQARGSVVSKQDQSDMSMSYLRKLASRGPPTFPLESLVAECEETIKHTWLRGKLLLLGNGSSLWHDESLWVKCDQADVINLNLNHGWSKETLGRWFPDLDWVVVFRLHGPPCQICSQTIST